MKSSQTNILVGLLAGMVVILIVAMTAIVFRPNTEKKSTTGDTNIQRDSRDSAATGDYKEIIQTAQQQANVDAADVEDEAALDNLTNAEISAIYNDGGLQ